MPRSGSDDAARLPEFGTNIPALDGVRGIAILLVLLFHYEIRTWPAVSLATRAVWWVVGLSWTGLELFFVLSGFLITGILYETRERPSFFRNFYMRRVLRILPLYYGFLFVLFVVAPALGLEDATPFGRQIWYWLHGTNFLFAFQGWQVSHRFTPHFWSLAVEEQYYLMWPLAVYLLRRRTLIWTCAAAIGVSLLLRVVALANGVASTTVTMVTFTHLDALAAGSLMALAVRGSGGLAEALRRARPVALAAAGALAVLFLALGTPDFQRRITQTLGFTLVAVLFAFLVASAVAVRPGSVVGRLLHWPALRTIGLRSYGVYVFHFPVMVYLQAHGLGVAALERMLGSTALAHLAWVAGNTAGSIALAMASWYLWERHFMKLKGLYSYGGKREREAEDDPTVSDAGRIVDGAVPEAAA